MVSETKSEVETKDDDSGDPNITDEQRRYLTEFILASKVTSSIYSTDSGIGWGSDNAAMGAIKIKRESNGTLMTRYNGSDKSEEQIAAGIEDGRGGFLNLGSRDYFFISDDQKTITVAAKDKNGNNQAINVEFFDGILSENTIPVMFFISLCETTQNPEYVSSLAKDVIKNTEIELSVIEEIETQTTTKISRRIKQTPIYSSETPDEIQGYKDADGAEWEEVSVNKEDEQSTSDETTVKIICKKADTLLYQYERDLLKEEYNTETEPTEKTNPTYVLHDGEEFFKYEDTYTSFKIGKKILKGPYTSARVKYKESDVFPKESNKKYDILDSKGKQSAYKSLEDGGDSLFEELERTTDNDRLIQVLKYVLYIMTNRSYGVTELDLDLNSATFYHGDFKVSTRENDLPIIDDVGELIEIFAKRNGMTVTEEQKKPLDPSQAKSVQSGSIDNAIKLHNFRCVAEGILEAQKRYEINALFLMACGEAESNTGSDSNNLLVKNATWNWTSMDNGNTMYGTNQFAKGDIYKNGSLLGYQELTDSGGFHLHCIYDSPVTSYMDFAHLSSVRVDAGFETVSKIGIPFCGTNWVTTVTKIIVEFVTSGGYTVSMGSGDAEMGPGDSEKGYDKTIKLNGRIFNDYKQVMGYYAEGHYISGGGGSSNTMRSQGCCPTAMAVIASGYTEKTDPWIIAQEMSMSDQSNSVAVFNSFGVPAVGGSLDSGAIANCLRNGGQVLLSTTRGNPYGERFIVSTNPAVGHLVALLDINERDEVFVANPNGGIESQWIPLYMAIGASSGKWCVFVGGN